MNEGPGKIAITFQFMKGMMMLAFCLFMALMSGGQTSGILTGTVTNLLSGNPVIGAKITAGTFSTYTVSGGVYTLNISAGSFQVTCSKAGFDDYSSPVITILPGSVNSLNIQIQERTNPPDSSWAFVDTTISPTGITIEWGIPSGPYEILRDDGIQDDFTVWATQGNMNATRFTPVSFPVKVTGGKVNIGSQSNYPPGSNPFVPFQIAVYSSTGPAGSPGNLIAGPFDVIPSALGWVTFTFPSPVLISEGDFYLVMIQWGNAPNAAGIGIDETNPQPGNYSRFVTGAGPWVPAQGNFMMRADVTGRGGPMPPLTTSSPSSPSGLLGYTVYRLRQGEEMNPAVWTTVGYPTVEKINDFAWLSLPCGPYRWGVRANYAANRVSPVTFSNVIGKCWTKSVTVEVDLSCPETPVSGTKIVMTNMVYPDTIYTALLTSANEALFPEVWKGTYEITVTRFGYQPSVNIESVAADTMFSVYLLQEKTAPYDLTVNDTSLLARWRPPRPEKELFHEDWISGSFSANQWIVDGGQNWSVSTAFGLPPPSAMFGYSPAVANYSQTLTSKEIQGEGSAILKLCYDIFLDNYGNTTLNQMAVELWDGSTWHLLKNYTNTSGDFDWTYQELDISAYSGSLFKIRFRAYGGDSYDINHWNIDNIKVIAKEAVSIAGSCVIGYYVYLNNILCNVTSDTSSYLPPEFVQYGSPATSCVTAIYASGPSIAVCSTFISHFLYPPTELTALPSGHDAKLAWNRPEMAGQPQTPPPGLLGYVIYRNGILIDTIPHPDTLNYQDTELFPSNYTYYISAYYDLLPYGFADTGISCKEGPAEVQINYGRELPFSEEWEEGSFSFNGWTAGDNWTVDMANGNPLPSAAFMSDPPLLNYNSALESDIFTAMDISCSKIWFDYDVRLIDRYLTGEEVLHCEIFYNNIWHTLKSYSNDGGFGWIQEHLDISAVKEKGFMVRFRAEGLSTGDIDSWSIDNIHLYAICKAPSGLEAISSNQYVTLTWDSPECEDGHGLSEGFEGMAFPPESWDQIITNASNTWYQSDLSLPTGVHTGDHAATVIWDYSHQDEWLIARDVLVTGNLTYWSHGFQGSVHQDHYYVKISENDGQSWITLSDLSAMAPFPSPNGYNQWETPYIVNLSPYLGQVVDIAWQAVDGDGQGLWYSWSIDDCSVGQTELVLSGGGYNIFRRDPLEADFIKINTAPVMAETYEDEVSTSGVYDYFVMQASDECSEYISSDTVTVDIVTGLTGVENAKITRIFPNPAIDKVNIRSDDYIKEVEFFNQNGYIFIRESLLNCKNITLSTQRLSAGIYFVKVITETSSSIQKVIIIK